MFGRLAAAGILALALALPLGPAAPQSARYPIWYSPALGLNGLESIDARLARDLPTDERVEATRASGADTVLVEATNCRTIKRLDDEGSLPKVPNDRFIFLYQKAICQALTMLKTAQPSRESYVRDITMGRPALEAMPPLVDALDGCTAICDAFAASQRRESWRTYSERTRINATRSRAFTFEVASEREMTVLRDDDQVTFELLARADFNRDELEDMLILVSRGVLNGAHGSAELFVLTRDSPAGVLRVVGGTRYLCPTAECSP